MAHYGVSTTITYVAWDTANNVGKTGDASNHTLRWIKDGTSSAPTNTPTEVDATNAPGVYRLTLTSTECQCLVGTLAGTSSSSGVSIVPITIAFEKLPNAIPGNNGGLPTVDSNNYIAGIQGTKNRFDSLNDLTASQVGTVVDTAIADAALAKASDLSTVQSTVNAVKAKTDNLPSSPAAVGSPMTLSANAVNADAVSSDAVTKIQQGLATAASLSDVASTASGIKSKTDNLPSSPAAVGSPMTLASGAVTEDSVTSGAVAKIQQGLATAASIDALNDVSAEEVSLAVLTRALGFSGSKDLTVREALRHIWSAVVGSVSYVGVYGRFLCPDNTVEAFVHVLDDQEAPTSRTVTIP